MKPEPFPYSPPPPIAGQFSRASGYPSGFTHASYVFPTRAWTVFAAESLATQRVVAEYKVFPCGDLRCCHGKLCRRFHSAAERRRPPFVGTVLVYSPLLCPFVSRGAVCPQADSCSCSHNSCESLYHPANYKRSQCTEGALCLGEFCPWFHYREEMRSAHLCNSYTQEFLMNPYQEYGECEMPASKADLGTFKTKMCPFQTQHNHKHCVYYHSVKDRRRPPGTYSAEKCDASGSSLCPLADKCSRSHSMVERLYHPDKFKTKYCNTYPHKLHECEYGSYCCFAHSDQELKVELLHYLEKDEDFYLFYFKTGWCPFNYEHNKAECVYAHNWQDFRRRPDLFQYINQLCSNWQSETFISDYKEGCIYEHNCGYCHGWKEQLYHPLTYKVTPCPDARRCRKGLECPYFHSEFDRRRPESLASLCPRPRSYFKSPRLTSTNNVNMQRENELRQFQFAMQNPAIKMERRFSEEVKYKSSLPSVKGQLLISSVKHRASYDLTVKPEKRAERRPALVNIAEENADSPHDDNLLEIFQPSESDGNTSLFFSPKIKCSAASHESAIVERTPLSAEWGRHKSCPTTPLPRAKEMGSVPALVKMELSGSEMGGVKGEGKAEKDFIDNDIEVTLQYAKDTVENSENSEAVKIFPHMQN